MVAVFTIARAPASPCRGDNAPAKRGRPRASAAARAILISARAHCRKKLFDPTTLHHTTAALFNFEWIYGALFVRRPSMCIKVQASQSNNKHDKYFFFISGKRFTQFHTIDINFFFFAPFKILQILKNARKTDQQKIH
jgi:hypothetical protein